jgi:hypothetical protein
MDCLAHIRYSMNISPYFYSPNIFLNTRAMRLIPDIDCPYLTRENKLTRFQVVNKDRHSAACLGGLPLFICSSANENESSEALEGWCNQCHDIAAF